MQCLSDNLTLYTCNPSSLQYSDAQMFDFTLVMLQPGTVHILPCVKSHSHMVKFVSTRG